MRIGVLGAGVIGVSTAYALARLGHDVTVIDKAEQVAMGASHANGAQLSYAYVDPLASPATRRKIPSYLLGLDPGVHLGLSLKPSYLHWGFKFMAACKKDNAIQSLKTRSELAIKSRDVMRLFEKELPKNALKPSSIGKLVLAADKKELAAMKKSSIEKKTLGLNTDILTRAECLEREPALESWTQQFVGATYSGDDTSLDPVTYCKALKTAGEKNFGVKFLFGETILKTYHINGSAARVKTDEAEHDFDRVVVCLGAEAVDLLNKASTPVPILPMQGYSLTLPTKQPALKTSITDPKNKIVFTRINNGIRIAGFMDANSSPRRAEKRARELKRLAQDLWPSIADFTAEPNYWTNFRPMTPSGVPIIGKSGAENIYLNLGHGSLGYTFAAGSAMVLADIIGHANKNE